MAKIKKDTSLRKAILQAAITGQLVSNVDGETETGKQLLDRIIEERNKKLLAEWEEKLKENLKTKKPTQIVASEIDDDEIPFEIPENWCWCRLGDVGDFLRGSGIKREETCLEGYPCIRYGEMYTKYKTVIKETVSFVEKEIFDKCQKIKTNDIVMSLTGENEYDIALAAVYLGEKVVAMGGDMTRFRPYLINSLFYVYAINSPYGIECKSQLATGNIIVHISNDKLSSILIPLPPLAVQNAIVAKLEEVIPLVDAYENAVLQKEELKNALPDKVKKAILQEAIQGKLTEDWRIEMLKQVQHDGHTEETGKQLLDRIIEERNAKLLADWEEKLNENPKNKKPTPIVASEIDEEEIPFEVPDSWCWCRIDDIFAHNSGKALNKTENKEGTELEYITTSNLYWNYFELDNLKTMLFKDSEIEKCTVQKGDLLVCEGGEVGRSAIWTFDKTVCIQNHIHRLRAYDSKLNVLFYYHVMYLFKVSKVIDNYAKGIGIKGLSSNALGSILVPLPPLAEQEKIVEIIEQMLPLCEKLGG